MVFFPQVKSYNTRDNHSKNKDQELKSVKRRKKINAIKKTRK